MADSPLACEPAGHHIGFFNGIWALQDDAEASFDALTEKLDFGDTFANGAPITYELYYNQGAPGELEDVAETFMQRTQEHDQILSNRWELFWEALRGDTQGASVTGQLAQVVLSFDQFRVALDRALMAHRLGLLGRLRDTPPTLEDYARHRELLDAHIMAQERFVFTGHSQGSLFLRAAYDYVGGLVPADTLRAVDIGPAAATRLDAHTLADNDLVIQALGLAGGTVLPTTVNIPLGRPVDPLGHDLVKTYLDETLDTGGDVRDQITAAMVAVQSSSPVLPDTLAPGICTAETADCDVQPLNGCEAHVLRDEFNCGACGSVCPAPQESQSFTGAACLNGSCAFTRAPATMTIAVNVVGGPVGSDDIEVFLTAFPPTGGSCGYPWWDANGRIPARPDGVTFSVGQGPYQFGWRFDGIDAYEVQATGDCFGFITAGNTYACDVTFCLGGCTVEP